MAKKQTRPSWDARCGPPTNESIAASSAPRLVVSLRGYAMVLRDIAEFLEGDEKRDVLYVADRLDLTVPALERKIREVSPPDRNFGRKTQKPLRGNE